MLIWSHIGRLSTPFSTSEMQNSRLDSNQESTGWLSLLHEQRTVPIVLLSTHAAQIVHTVFIFSKHPAECDERWFSVSHTLRYHSRTSMAVILQSSSHPSDIFIRFRCSRPFAPLCVSNRLLTRRKWLRH